MLWWLWRGLGTAVSAVALDVSLIYRRAPLKESYGLLVGQMRWWAPWDFAADYFGYKVHILLGLKQAPVVKPQPIQEKSIGSVRNYLAFNKGFLTSETQSSA